MAIFKGMSTTRNVKIQVKLLSSIGTLAFLFSSTSAYSDFLIHHWEDHYEPTHSITLRPEVDYYNTHQNYDSQGNPTTPPGLSRFSRAETDLLGQFGLLDQLSLFGRLTWTREQLDVNSITAATYGLSDQSLGASFRALESTAKLDFQVQLDLPAYSNNASLSSPFLGDQSWDLTAGGFLNIPIAQTQSHAFLATLGTGYTFRSGSFSPQIPWTIQAQVQPKNQGFLFGLSAFGTSSLQKDPTPTLAPLANGYLTGTGGSFFAGGVNSAQLLIAVQGGYQFGPNSRLMIAYEQSAWGQNSPISSNLILGYHFSLGPKSPGSKIYAKSNQGLHEYTLDAKVLKSNDRLNLIKIDKGSQDGIAPGQLFDLFKPGADGAAAEAIARAQVTHVKTDEAALKIIEFYKEVWIDEGFIAKMLVQ